MPPLYLERSTPPLVSERPRNRQKADELIWDMPRIRVWQIAKEVMIAAGLRLHMLQKWMGHVHLSTTQTYADAMGQEEQDIASRM